MKKLLPWLLLAIYLNASAQMVLPFARDMFAHLFFWQEHLEHVHHGHAHSDHVHLELTKADGDKDHPVSYAFHKDALSAHLVPECVAAAKQADAPLIALMGNWRFPSQTAFSAVISPPPDRV